MTHHTAQNVTHSHKHSEVLNQVREAMTVYDSERNDIGTVETVYFGAAGAEELAHGTAPATTPTTPIRDGDSFMDALADVFDPDDNIPQELAERLRYHGFIKIDGGWFGSDRYVMPDQISSVSDEGVYLNTKRERLVKD